MALDFDGTDDTVELASAAITAAPATMACFFNGDSFATQQALLACSATGSNNRFVLFAGNAVNLGKIVANAVNAGTNGVAAHSTSLSTGTTYHAAALFESSTSRRAVLNGNISAADTTSCTPTAGDINRTNVAGRYNVGSLAGAYANARIWEAAIWNAVLDQAELDALKNGVCPLFIRRSALVWYTPLIRDARNLRGGNPTTTGTTVAAHGRIIYPRGAMLRRFNRATGGASGTAAQTLPSLRQAASGGQTFSGSAAQVLPNIEQAATAVMHPSGTIAQVLPNMEQAAAGIEQFTGTAAQVLPNIEQAATGSMDEGAAGTTAQTLPNIEQAASGTEGFTGSIAQALPSLRQAASGVMHAAGTIAQTLAHIVQALSGTVTNPPGTGGNVKRWNLRGGFGRQSMKGRSGYRR